MTDKTAKILHIVTDDGHYGFSCCGNCNKELTEEEMHKNLQCLGCEAKLEPTSSAANNNWGGSDF